MFRDPHVDTSLMEEKHQPCHRRNWLDEHR
jgi:hypothetical protein